jgi:hypothetical protein
MSRSSNVSNAASQYGISNLPIPTMRDVAKYETSRYSKSTPIQQNIVQMHDTLEKIAHPERITSTSEREHYTSARNNLLQAKTKGDPIAISIISAINSTSNKTQVAGDSKSGTVTGTNLPGEKVQDETKFPVVNNVQSVNLDDYEQVRKTWTENYTTMEVPSDNFGKPQDRKVWIEEDKKQTNKTIELLTSVDPQKQKEGTQMVSHVLPFLLVGGFSQTEVIAYLKAKMKAAENVLETLKTQEKSEDTLLPTSNVTKKPEAGEMHAQAEIPDEKKI